MFKRFLFTLIALTMIVFITTPAFAQDFSKNPKVMIENWTTHVQSWVEDSEFDPSSPLIESLKEFFRSGEVPEIEIKKGPAQPPGETTGNPSSAKSLAKEDPSSFEKEVVELVNDERTERGLEPLKMHKRLSDLARMKSQDMADKKYFSHTSPTYGSPFDMMNQFDFEYRAAGENIAAGQRTPEQVVEGWMNSEGHRANILQENFTHIGVGFVKGSGPYGTYWTQLFMTPR